MAGQKQCNTSGLLSFLSRAFCPVVRFRCCFSLPPLFCTICFLPLLSSPPHTPNKPQQTKNEIKKKKKKKLR